MLCTLMHKRIPIAEIIVEMLDEAMQGSGNE